MHGHGLLGAWQGSEDLGVLDPERTSRVQLIVQWSKPILLGCNWRRLQY